MFLEISLNFHPVLTHSNLLVPDFVICTKDHGGSPFCSSVGPAIYLSSKWPPRDDSMAAVPKIALLGQVFIEGLPFPGSRKG